MANAFLKKLHTELPYDPGSPLPRVAEEPKTGAQRPAHHSHGCLRDKGLKVETTQMSAEEGIGKIRSIRTLAYCLALERRKL